MYYISHHYLSLSKILASGKRHYICNVFLLAHTFLSHREKQVQVWKNTRGENVHIVYLHRLPRRSWIQFRNQTFLFKQTSQNVFLYEFYICEVWVSCIQLPIIIQRQINLLLAVCNLKYSLERHIKLKTSYNPTKLITQKSRRFGIFQSTWQYHLWKISKREPSKWMLCTKQEFVSFGL